MPVVIREFCLSCVPKRWQQKVAQLMLIANSLQESGAAIYIIMIIARLMLLLRSSVIRISSLHYSNDNNDNTTNAIVTEFRNAHSL